VASLTIFLLLQWGIQWSFAHNGDVPFFKCKRGELPWIGEVEGERTYNPVGDTDSEKIFCSTLNAIKAKFSTLPSMPVLHEYLRVLLREIAEHDEEAMILNFLFGCGQHVQFAYSWPGSRSGSKVWNGLHYVVREPPFKRAALTDCDYEVDFAQLTDAGDRVAIITTKPLTLNEEWVEFERGELILFDEGLPLKTPEESMTSELSGHGLATDYHPRALQEDTRRFKSKRIFTGEGI